MENSIDSRLLNREQEGDAADELKNQKSGNRDKTGRMKRQNNNSPGGSYFDALTQTAYNLGGLLGAKNQAGAAKQGLVMGVQMRQAIKQGDFSGGNFITVLLLSVLKDFVDIVAIGTIGVLINIPITIFLFIVFFMQLSVIKKYLLKRFIWPMIIEFIPFLSIFPAYTISTIWLKMKIDKRNKEMQAQLDQLEGEFNLNQNSEYARNS